MGVFIIMHPYLKERVVLVEGPLAFGVYNLNVGKFHRVTKSAGQLLSQLNGLRHTRELPDNMMSFLNLCHKHSLIEFQDAPIERKPTPLSQVARKYRSARFAWIEVTSRCHQRCLHCFLGNDLNATRHVPLDKIKRYIDVLVKIGVKQIVISGGEPTLHPQIRDILHYATEFPIQVSILTTASNIQCRELAPLFSEKYVNVKIPILGWESTHDAMTQRNGSFSAVIESIKCFMQNGVPLELGTTVTKINLQDMPRIRQFANDMGLKLEVSPIYKIGFAEHNADQLLGEDQRRIIDTCKLDKSVAKKSMYRPNPPGRPLPPPDVTDYAAVDLRDYLTTQHECGQKIVAILANGNVTPCLLLRDAKFCIGSTNSHDLEEILSEDFSGRSEFDDYMALHHIPGCNKCEARYICKAGGCPATSFALKKTVHVKNPMFTKCYYTHERTRADVGLPPIDK